MARIDEISQEIKNLQDKLKIVEDEFFKDTNLEKSFEQYEKRKEPFISKLLHLDRELRLIMIPVFDDEIENGDDVMSIEEFIGSVNEGFFIDYDGFGCYTKDKKISNIKVYPSDVSHNSLRKDFDTIVWYNR